MLKLTLLATDRVYLLTLSTLHRFSVLLKHERMNITFVGSKVTHHVKVT